MQKLLKAVLIARQSAVRYASKQRSAAPISTDMKFTSELHKEIKKNEKFNSVNGDHLAYFRSVLGESNVLVSDSTEQFSLSKYNVDWMRQYRGDSKAVLRPDSTEQISKLLRYCNQHYLPIVPQGGNTGLVGASTAVFDETVMSLERMNRVLSFDELSGVVVVEPGCVLEALDDYLAQRGYMVPLDLGAKGSCQIGGNLSTNAGGIRFLRFGSLHGNVLGLEVVLADGTVLDLLNQLRKDNTGYDLKQLFIGGEGTLGVISKIALLTAPRPKSQKLAFLCCQSYEQVLRVLRRAKQELTEVLSAFEFMDGLTVHQTLRCLATRTGMRHPFGEAEHTRTVNDAENFTPFYIIVEVAGSCAEHDEAKLNAFLQWCMSDGGCTNGVVAQDTKQLRALWQIREYVAEASQGYFHHVSEKPFFFAYDISITQSKMYDLVHATRAMVAKADLRSLGLTHRPVTVGFGHIVDSNLHINISTERFSEQQERLFDNFVFDWTIRNGGSISAEHGIGIHKKRRMHAYKPSAVTQSMAQVKHLFDPKGILNPYKVVNNMFH